MLRKIHNLKINLNLLFQNVKIEEKKYIEKLNDKTFILEKIIEKKENFRKISTSGISNTTQLSNNLHVLKIFTNKLLHIIIQMKLIKFLIRSFNSNKIINIKNKENFLVHYIIEIKFTRTDTFLTVKNSLNEVWVFYSASSFELKNKEKTKRFLVLKKFYAILVFKITFLKNRQIALHLINVGFFKKAVIKKLKKFFFIQTFQYCEEHPYNGCRKKKKTRKKRRTDKKRKK
jgi:hypothetical protein